MVDLRGRNAIVTGAAIGLGKGYAQALADAGVNLAVCDVREEVLDLPASLSGAGASRVKILAWQGDVADPAHVRAVVDGARERFGSIDMLINNAGVWRESKADDDLEKSLEDYEEMVGANLKGPYLFGRAVMPIMIEQGVGGDIVNVATDHMVTCGTPWHVCPRLATCPWRRAPRPTGGGETMDIYDAAKWGLNGFLYAWAKALAPHGIRVNQLCMGATDTHMLRSFYGVDPSPEEEASWMKVADNARVLVELLEEGPAGRNAQSLNFCVGRPVRLEPLLAQRYVRAGEIEVVSR